MSDVSDFYTSSITDEVVAAIQSTIQKAESNRDIDDLVVRHLMLASDALESEKTKRTASSFRQNHGALNPVQLDKAKSVLSKKAFASNALMLAATACSMSVGHFERCFKVSAGTSPHRWITHVRMKTAKYLLMSTNQPIADVAVQCGYTEQCHFTRIFSREVGMSPGAWRRLLNNLLRSA